MINYPYNLLIDIWENVPNKNIAFNLNNVDTLLRTLSDKDRNIIDMRYNQGYTLQYIADMNNVSRQNIQQTISRIVERLATPTCVDIMAGRIENDDIRTLNISKRTLRALERLGISKISEIDLINIKLGENAKRELLTCGVICDAI